MTVPFHGDGIISQFEGYDQLEEFDWEAARAKYGDIQRLDRILKAEGDTPDRYKLSKQADVLMLFYLLPPEELAGIFEELGYTFTPDTIRKTVEYYLPRTSHGSTLSKLVHASVIDRIDRRGGLGSLPGGAPGRLRRRPGRHHPGGHPPRGHGRHPGHRPAPLRGDRHHRRRDRVPSAAARGPREPAAAGATPGTLVRPPGDPGSLRAGDRAGTAGTGPRPGLRQGAAPRARRPLRVRAAGPRSMPGLVPVRAPRRRAET